MVRFTLQLPYDPRAGECVNVPAYNYVPLAFDRDGGLWLRIVDDAGYLPEPIPCALPVPPAMPSLIRIDSAALVAANAVSPVPMSSSALVILGGFLAAFAVLRLPA